jgi:hypothetical protein
MNTDHIEKAFDEAVRATADTAAYDIAAAMMQRDSVRRAVEQHISQECPVQPHLVSKCADGVMGALDAASRGWIGEIAKAETGQYPASIANQVVHHPAVFQFTCETYLSEIVRQFAERLNQKVAEALQ